MAVTFGVLGSVAAGLALDVTRRLGQAGVPGDAVLLVAAEVQSGAG